MASHDNTGGLWKNKNKDKPQSPDFVGQITVEGQTYYIAAWENRGQGHGGRPQISIRVNEKVLDKQYQHPPQGGKDKDDDTPF